MEQLDAIILGGGLVGGTLAAALDAQGLRAAVVDPIDPATTLSASFDGRASAIASASHRMLDAIGIGARLRGQGCPIAGIRVSDGLAPGAVDFTPDADDGALGVMYENRLLRAAIQAALRDASTLDLRYGRHAATVARDAGGVTVTLDTGDVLTAPVLLAADGRASPMREQARIGVARWQYDHAAIITAFRHAEPHDRTAYEIFYPSGPFAILPLPDDAHAHRSALVWTVAKRDLAGMLKLSDRGFLAEAEARMGGFLGPLSDLAHRASYPLGFHRASTLVAERLALVGDAGHGIHPIAGQGLNLGLRDVAALVEVLVEGKRLGLDLGDAALLARYDRWRGLDTALVSVATDGLARLFGIPGALPSAVRRLGLSAVQRIEPLKARFMAEARGESGELPALLRGVLA